MRSAANSPSAASSCRRRSMRASSPPAAVPAGHGRAGHRPRLAAERDVLENARRRWPAVALRGRLRRHAGPGSAAEVIEAVRRLDRDPAVDVIVIARGGGSVEDLLPFSDEAPDPGRLAGPHPGGLRDRPRARLPAARPGRRRPRLDARPTPPSWSSPTSPRSRPGRAHGRGAGRLLTRLAGPRAARRSTWSGPAGDRRPRERPGRAASRGRGAPRPRPAHAAPPARPGRQRPRPPAGPGAGCRRWPRCAGGTPWSRTPTGTSSPPSTQVRADQALQVRVVTAGSAPSSTRTDKEEDR